MTTVLSEDPKYRARVERLDWGECISTWTLSISGTMVRCVDFCIPQSHESMVGKLIWATLNLNNYTDTASLATGQRASVRILQANADDADYVEVIGQVIGRVSQSGKDYIIDCGAPLHISIQSTGLENAVLDDGQWIRAEGLIDLRDAELVDAADQSMAPHGR